MKYFLALVLMALNIGANAQSRDELYKKARGFYEKEDYSNALVQVNAVLAKDSTDLDGLILKGNTLERLKKYQEAFDTYSYTVAMYPSDVIAINQRGLLLNKLQEFEYAIMDFTNALGLPSPDSLKLVLYVNRGAAKVNIRDFKGAYDDFMAAYKIDSLQIGILNNLAAVCDEVGKGDQTLKYLYRVLEIDSTFIGAYGNIGFKYQEMGDYKKAIGFFDKVLSLSPDDALAYSNRSFNRYKLGDLAGALTDANKAIELYPSNSYAFRNRALIYLAMKKNTEACADLKEALDIGFTKMYGDEVQKLVSAHCQ